MFTYIPMQFIKHPWCFWPCDIDLKAFQTIYRGECITYFAYSKIYINYQHYHCKSKSYGAGTGSLPLLKELLLNKPGRVNPNNLWCLHYLNRFTGRNYGTLVIPTKFSHHNPKGIWNFVCDESYGLPWLYLTKWIRFTLFFCVSFIVYEVRIVITQLSQLKNLWKAFEY